MYGRLTGISLHGFADESQRGGLYLITTVMFPVDALKEARRCVAGGAQPGSRRTHFSAESDKRRRQVLRRYLTMAGSVQAHVVTTPYAGGNDQPARDRCLQAVIELCIAKQVARLVLDTRHPDRDHLDRRTIAAALASTPGADLEYLHRGSREEELLSWPDALGWAWGAKGRWRPLVAPMIETVLERPI